MSTRSVTTLLLILAAGCGDGGGTAATGPDNPPPDPPEQPTGPQEAPAPTLSTTQAQPFHAVVLGGLPAGLDLAADVSAAGTRTASDSATFLLPLVHLGGGSYKLFIPVHPTNLADGGEVDIRVHGATFLSKPARLTLEPLPPAPGALLAFRDSLQALLDLERAQTGLTRAELMAASRAPGFDPALLPLAMAQAVLDDPTMDGDVQDLLDGSPGWNAVLGAGPRDLELADRILGASGLLPSVNGALSRARALEAPQGMRAQESSLLDHGYDFSNAAALDWAMAKASSAAREIDPNSATGELLQAYGLTLGALGVVGGQPGAITAAVGGSVLWAYSTYLEGASKLLPSSFVEGSLSFHIDIPEFLEDQDGPGHWTQVTVSAQSEGWTVDKALLGLALQSASNLRAMTVVDDLMKAKVAKETAEKAAAFLSDLAGFFLSLVGSQLPAGEGAVTIEPRTWDDVDISDESWSEARVAGDAIILGAHGEYLPWSPGQAVLTVETEISRFGNATPASSQETVTVRGIEIRIRAPGSLEWLADRTTVQPGAQVPLEIHVLNAEDVGLTWSLSGGGWAQEPFQMGDDMWYATVQTPIFREAFPIWVTFTSTATGGARNNPAAPERSATVQIQAGHIIVDPPSLMMSAGESQQFQAIVLGLENKEVTWRAEGPGGPAAISDNGLFTAPNELGDYLVVATSVEDPEVEGYANVAVVGRCYWTLAIDGPHGGTWSGGAISHVYAGELSEGSPFSMAFTVDDSDESDLLGWVGASAPSQGGEVGNLGEASLSFSPSTGIQWTYVPESGSMYIAENDGDVLKGTVTGLVFRVFPGPEIHEAAYTLTFRSVYMSDCGF